MLELLSDLFYDPLVFWGTPMVLAMLQAGIRRVRARGRRPR
jgi:hypothetical protein